MPQVLHVHPQLVRPSRLGEQPDEGERLEPLRRLVIRHRRTRPRPRLADHHLLAFARIDPQVGLNPVAVAIEHSPHNRHVLFFDLPPFELPRQSMMHLVVLGHHHHPGGVAVQAMHNARSIRSRHIAQPVEVVLQRTHQGPPLMPPARVHHHVRRLVQHHQVRVFKQHFQRQILGDHRPIRLSG